MAAQSPDALPSGPGAAESRFVLLPVRLILAGLFGFAAFLKLQDPQAFAFAIKGFEMLDPEKQGHAITMLAFGIPWAEMIVAFCLVIGFWTRGAALLLMLMVAGFTAGIVSLMARGIDADCSCFGKLKLMCDGAAGACHVVRNSVILLLTALLVVRGGGRLTLDRLLAQHKAG